MSSIILHFVFYVLAVLFGIRFGIFYERFNIKRVFYKRYGVKITNEVFKEVKE